MRGICFAFLIACGAGVSHADAQDCEASKNANKIALYHSQLSGSNDNDWQTIGINWTSNFNDCRDFSSINIETKERFGQNDTSVTGMYSHELAKTRRISLGIEFAPNAVFSANSGIEASYSQKISGFDPNQTSVLFVTRAGFKNYENTNSVLIGIGAEIYPNNSDAWFAFEAAQNIAFDEALPLAYSARASLPLSQKAAIFANAGHYFETYSTSKIAINEYALGIDYGIKENLRFKAYVTGLKQEGLSSMSGFGISLGLRL